MRSSAKLLLAVIYYLGRQGCDARQITGPVGGQDTREAGYGGWKDEGEEQGPRTTATLSSSSAQQNLWGGLVTAGSWRAFSKAPVETQITLIAQSIKEISSVSITRLSAFKAI